MTDLTETNKDDFINNRPRIAKTSWYKGKMPRTKAQLLAERKAQEALIDKNELKQQIDNRESAPAQVPSQAASMNRNSSIKYVLAITSGKGGVGKSMLVSTLAVALQSLGLKIGILDADVTGPSIPQAFGLHEHAYASSLGLMPEQSDNEIKIMSVNLILDNPNDPIAWRAPIINTAIKQFWTDVVWGDLDILLIDMPPGTGDVPLTVFQAIPVTAAIILSSPQALVQTIVEKSVKLLKKMNMPLLALIENFAYFECPDCNAHNEIYGPSKLAELNAVANANLTWQIPILPELAKLIDAGQISSYRNDHFYNLARQIYACLQDNYDQLNQV